MLKILVIILVWANLSFALSVTYKQIVSAPKSFEKDFYIYLYLQQNPPKYQVKRLFKQVRYFNYRLKKAFARYGLKPKRRYGKYKKPLECFCMEDFTKLPPYQFLKIFKRLSTWHIQKYLNTPIDKKYMQKLAHYKLFEIFVKKVLRTKAYRLKNSLKGIKSLNTKAETSFALALLNLEDKNLATFYLKRAKRYAISQFKKDRATLWLYLVTKKRSYLRKLAHSKEVNIYSLYAVENTNAKAPRVVVNIRHLSNKEPNWNYLSPLEWAKKRKRVYKRLKHLSYKKKIHYLRRVFRTKKEMSHLVYFLDDITKKNYFIMGYKDNLKRYSKKRQALMLAIARQESKFIPTAISPSFALGLMQFMPFLAKDMAKKLHIKNFQLEDMFKPKLAYKFANKHLDYLQKYLYNPLLVAYAYNGGIGYTKRKILRSGKYFKNREYEPFYSLEMIKPQEPMHYAKKVLANYVVYANLLGVKVSITNLLYQLLQISKVHCF